MEITRKMIKALSADTRLDILKSLKERRKMPSELSKELKLTGSTIVEHLKKLEDAGLIEKQERGEKWIYYELTENGKSLVQPKIPIQFVLILSLGLMFIFGGLLNLTSTSYFQGAKTASTEMTSVAGIVSDTSAPIITSQINWFAIIVIIVGIILITYAFLKKRNEPVISL